MRQPRYQILNSHLDYLVFACAIAIGLLVGCSKKKPELVATPESVPAAAAPANPGDANAAVVATSPDKPLDLAPVQKAIKTGDYDKAAADLLALQRISAQMTPQQQTAVADQMRMFQRSLATAVASGDANAQAAAKRLREAAMHR